MSNTASYADLSEGPRTQPEWGRIRRGTGSDSKVLSHTRLRGLGSLSHLVELSLFPVFPYLIVTEISSIHSNIDTGGKGLYES